MECGQIAELVVAVGTWALVVVTWRLVRATWRQGKRQIEAQLSAAKEQLEGQLSVAREQLRVQFFLEMRKQFDGSLLHERKLLAQQFKAGAAHDEINERVPDFFEDLGMLVRRDYIDREMVWDTFSYYAIRWVGRMQKLYCSGARL
jgi:hypothetical protein